MNKKFKVGLVGLLSFAIMISMSGVASAAITLGATSAVSDGALTLTGATASSWTTSAGALTVTGAAASTWSTAAGDLTVEAGTTTPASLKLISDEATADAINMDATAGGLDIDTDSTVVVTTTNDEIQLTAGTADVVIAGSAEGTAALTLTAGDAVVTDGDLTVTGGNVTVTGTGVTTADLIDIAAAANTTGDIFDINSPAITTGNVFDIDVAATRTSGAAILVTDNSATGVATVPLIDVNVAGTNDSHTLDITYAAASTGNAVDLNMGSDVAGDAINIASAATSGHAILIDSTGTVTDSLIDVDMSAGDWQGNIIEITTGSTASDGDVINITNEANDLTTQVLVVSNAAISSTDGWLISADTTAAWTGNAIAFDNSGDDAWTGNIIDIATGDGASTGNIIDVAIEASSLTTQALVVNNAAISSTAGWLLQADTTAAWTGNAIQFDNSGDDAWTGNVIDIDTGNGASTGNIIDIAMEASSLTTQALVVNNAAISSTNGWLLQADTTAAWTGHAVLIDNSGNDAWTGDVFNILTGTGDHTGQIFDITMEASTAGDGNFLKLANADVSDQAGWLMDIDTTGIWTGNMIDIKVATAAGTGNVLFVDNDTDVAGHMVYIDSDADRAAGALIKLDDAGDDTANAGTIDIDVTGAADIAAIKINTAAVGAANVAGGLDITGTGNLADTNSSLVRVTSSSTTAGGSMVELAKTGDLAGASADGAVLKITETGAAAATSYAAYISSTNNEALHVDAGVVLIDETLTVSGGATIGAAGAGLTYYELTEAATATDTLAATETGKTVYIASAAAASVYTLPAPGDGLVFRFVVAGALANNVTVVTNASANIIEGALIVAGAVVDCATEDTITFDATGENVGDFVELRSDGTNWFIGASGALTAAKLTCTQAS